MYRNRKIPDTERMEMRPTNFSSLCFFFFFLCSIHQRWCFFHRKCWNRGKIATCQRRDVGLGQKVALVWPVPGLITSAPSPFFPRIIATDSHVLYLPPILTTYKPINFPQQSKRFFLKCKSDNAICCFKSFNGSRLQWNKVWVSVWFVSINSSIYLQSCFWLMAILCSIP